MKVALYVAALLILGLTACGKKEEAPAPAPVTAPVVEAPAATVSPEAAAAVPTSPAPASAPAAPAASAAPTTK